VRLSFEIQSQIVGTDIFHKEAEEVEDLEWTSALIVTVDVSIRTWFGDRLISDLGR